MVSNKSVRTCPKCHRENPNDVSFCGYCGTALPVEIIPKYLPGFEPVNIRKYLDVFFSDVNRVFPDKRIVWSEWNHERWDNAANSLCKALGYNSGRAILEAYGYVIIQENRGRNASSNDETAKAGANQTSRENGYNNEDIRQRSKGGEKQNKNLRRLSNKKQPITKKRKIIAAFFAILAGAVLLSGLLFILLDKRENGKSKAESYIYKAGSQQEVSVYESNNDTGALFDLTKSAFSDRFNRCLREGYADIGSIAPDFDISKKWENGGMVKQDKSRKPVFHYYVSFDSVQYMISEIDSRIYGIRIVVRDVNNDSDISLAKVLTDITLRAIYGFNQENVISFLDAHAEAINAAAGNGMNNAGLYHNGALYIGTSEGTGIVYSLIAFNRESVEKLSDTGVSIQNYDSDGQSLEPDSELSNNSSDMLADVFYEPLASFNVEEISRLLVADGFLYCLTDAGTESSCLYRVRLSDVPGTAEEVYKEPYINHIIQLTDYIVCVVSEHSIYSSLVDTYEYQSGEHFAAVSTTEADVSNGIFEVNYYNDPTSYSFTINGNVFRRQVDDRLLKNGYRFGIASGVFPYSGDEDSYYEFYKFNTETEEKTVLKYMHNIQDVLMEILEITDNYIYFYPVHTWKPSDGYQLFALTQDGQTTIEVTSGGLGPIPWGSGVFCTDQYVYLNLDNMICRVSPDGSNYQRIARSYSGNFAVCQDRQYVYFACPEDGKLVINRIVNTQSSPVPASSSEPSSAFVFDDSQDRVDEPAVQNSSSSAPFQVGDVYANRDGHSIEFVGFNDNEYRVQISIIRAKFVSATARWSEDKGLFFIGDSDGHYEGYFKQEGSDYTLWFTEADYPLIVGDCFEHFIKQDGGSIVANPYSDSGYPSVYDDLLNTLRTAEREHWNEQQFIDHNLSDCFVSCIESPYSSIGYCMMDVDQNGIPELFLGSIMADGSYYFSNSFYNMFTYLNGELSCICTASSSSGDFYAYLHDDIFSCTSQIYSPDNSNGMIVYYMQYANGFMQAVDGYESIGWDKYRISMTSGDKIPITDNDILIMYNQWMGGAQEQELPYIPL